MDDIVLTAALEIWGKGGPLHRRLTQALSAAIAGGELPRGALLPSDRTLARALGVSRGTVVAAYEALRERRLIERRVGSGTRVAGQRAPEQPGEGEEASPVPGSWARRAWAGKASRADSIDLTGSGVPWLEDLVQRAAAAAISHLADDSDLRDPGTGSAVLRRAIASHLSQTGIPTDDSQILVTEGRREAVMLVAGSLLCPGAAAAVDEVTSLEATDGFAAAGARLLPMGAQGGAIDLAALGRAVNRGSIRLVYAMPSFHDPTGAVMPESARRLLALLATTCGIPVVEDNSLADLLLFEDPLCPVAGFAPTAPVLSIGSLETLFWTGIGIGWIRAPAELVARLARFRAAVREPIPPLSQLVAAELFNHFETARARRRRQLVAGLGAIESLLATLLPSWTWARPAGGCFLWVRLPGADCIQFAHHALRKGVAVVPGSAVSPLARHREFLRLAFLCDQRTLTTAVQRLAAAWAAHSSARRQEQLVRSQQSRR